MTKTLQLAGISVAIFITILAIFFYQPVQPVQSSTWPGNMQSVATSSFQAVSATTVELLYATSSCSSRVIGTQGGEIRLTFSDYKGERPTGTNGFPQNASTTVVYEAETYGCGAIYVYPYYTGTLTISEYR